MLILINVLGYVVQGTLAKAILSEPEDITTMTGQKLPLKMSVDYISFSAHTDYQQTREFINILKPPHIVKCSNLINNIILLICTSFLDLGTRRTK